MAQDVGDQDLGREIASELAEFTDLLAGLSPEQWERPTLCERWQVRQVAGHIIGGYDPALTVWRGLFGAMGNGFSFDKYLDAFARAHEAGRTPEELVEALRTLDLTRGIARFVPPRRRLHEHVVHHQDVRRPLGRPRRMPEARLRTVLGVAHAPQREEKPAKWAKGLAFAATDLEWRAGEGPTVEGPGEALLMALSQRPVALDELTGAGLATFREQLAQA
jgi:uncharacterized protein (TIGR03083 family)